MASTAASVPKRTPSTILAVALLLVLGYTVLAGGTALGELAVVHRVAATIAGGLVLATAVWNGMRRADWLDNAVMAAAVTFASAGVLSALPRQAFDAVVGALVLATGLYLARQVSASAKARRWFEGLLMVLSTLLTLVTAARWFPVLVESAMAAGSPLPQLTLDLPATPWGHRYDLVLLLLLLYPAWWLRPDPGRLRAALRLVIGALVAAAVVVTGSRTLWASVAIATALVVLPIAWRHRPRGRSALVAGMGVAVAAVTFLVVSGAGQAIVDRAVNTESLDWRLEIWTRVVDGWAERPIAGLGPGTFPWFLHTTTYFDSNAWPPRHPDNAMIQVVAEAGVLGVLAAVTAATSVVVAVVRGRSRVALWAVALVLLASLSANPTDFMFINATMVGWVAYGVPHSPPDAMGQQPRMGAMRWIGAAAVVVVGAATTVFNGAAVAYGAAQEHVDRADTDAARAALDIAVRLDPGMALYHRQRASLAMTAGTYGAAVDDLVAAARINPLDPITWRVLALALEEQQRGADALEAARRAVDMHRSDPTNLLLLARLEQRWGSPDLAQTLIVEAVHGWPHLVAAEGWSELTAVPSSTVIDAAIERWASGAAPPDRPADQPLWLVAMGNRTELDARATESAMRAEPLAQIAIGLNRCEPDAAARLADLPPSAQRDPFYGMLRTMADRLAISRDLDTSDVPWTRAKLNPLNDNTVLPSDAFGYRRPSIAWPASPYDLPSPAAGEERWVTFPVQAAMVAGLDEQLPRCRVTEE